MSKHLLVSLLVFSNIEEIPSTTGHNSSTDLENTNILYKILMCANKPSAQCPGVSCPVGALPGEQLQGQDSQFYSTC